MITPAPSPGLPLSSPQWRGWFNQVYATGQAIEGVDPTNPNFGKIPPVKLYVGSLAYADGILWNPGSGAGYYRWTGSAWHYIG